MGVGSAAGSPPGRIFGDVPSSRASRQRVPSWLAACLPWALGLFSSAGFAPPRLSHPPSPSSFFPLSLFSLFFPFPFGPVAAAGFAVRRLPAAWIGGTETTDFTPPHPRGPREVPRRKRIRKLLKGSPRSGRFFFGRWVFRIGRWVRKTALGRWARATRWALGSMRRWTLGVGCPWIGRWAGWGGRRQGPQGVGGMVAQPGAGRLLRAV